MILPNRANDGTYIFLHRSSGGGSVRVTRGNMGASHLFFDAQGGILPKMASANISFVVNLQGDVGQHC
eukprot:UN05799